MNIMPFTTSTFLINEFRFNKIFLVFLSHQQQNFKNFIMDAKFGVIMFLIDGLIDLCNA